MSIATLISTSEYLNSTYRPDCDLIDGQLIERNMGEFDHSKLQGTLTGWFYIHQREWNIYVLPEQRVQVKSSRFRIPDVCIVSRDQPKEPVITQPPLICIEVLSKDDTLRGMQARIDDYLDFAVPNIWIVDPASRRAYICSRSGFFQPDGSTLEVPSSPISIPLAALFAELD